MRIFYRYQLELAFYNDSELVVAMADESEIPTIHGCVCKITNLDNEQQAVIMVPAPLGFKDTPNDREMLRNIAIEKARQSLNIYDRNLHTLRTSKPETDNLDRVE